MVLTWQPQEEVGEVRALALPVKASARDPAARARQTDLARAPAKVRACRPRVRKSSAEPPMSTWHSGELGGQPGYALATTTRADPS
jgi:hypothetical protein